MSINHKVPHVGHTHARLLFLPETLTQFPFYFPFVLSIIESGQYFHSMIIIIRVEIWSEILFIEHKLKIDVGCLLTNITHTHTPHAFILSLYRYHILPHLKRQLHAEKQVIKVQTSKRENRYTCENIYNFWSDKIFYHFKLTNNTKCKQNCRHKTDRHKTNVL